MPRHPSARMRLQRLNSRLYENMCCICFPAEMGHHGTWDIMGHGTSWDHRFPHVFAIGVLRILWLPRILEGRLCIRHLRMVHCFNTCAENETPNSAMKDASSRPFEVALLSNRYSCFSCSDVWLKTQTDMF